MVQKLILAPVCSLVKMHLKLIFMILFQVNQDDLDTLRTQMIVVTSVIGGIVILILILVLALAVSISR